MAQRNYVIIIGAMKSGTTTLFDTLARHPAIAPAQPKEPGFFAFDDLWSKGFDWFDTLFDFDPARHVYRLDGSTDYTKAPFIDGVWERMTADPDVSVKLLYIMRHPLRRIESHARHVQGARKELGQEISPRADHGLDAGLSPVNLAVSHYATQLDAFAEAHATGRLHCLTLERLKRDPEGTMADVLAFLELEPVPETAEVPQSNAAGTRTAAHPLWKAARQVGPLMALGRNLLPQSARRALRDRFRTQVRNDGRFKLNAAETRLLESLYAPDIARLGDYGIDTKTDWTL